MQIFFLLILAIAPAVALMAYILYKDRFEPEPIGLIIKTIILGSLSVIIAALLEFSLLKLPFFQTKGITGAAIQSFLVIAPIEELLKLGVVLIFIWKNKNFNEINDGIVYVGSVALGFAMCENILYVFHHGFTVGFGRALTAVPMHVFTGILMGYFVGIAKFSKTKTSTKINILKGFFIAYFIHAIYDTFALSGTTISILLIPLIIATTIFGVIFLNKGSKISEARWANVDPEEIISSRKIKDTPTKPAKPFKKWKIIISRLLLSTSLFCWLILFVAITSSENQQKTTDIIAGGILLTFIPILIGIILEVSYFRDKKYKRGLQK